MVKNNYKTKLAMSAVHIVLLLLAATCVLPFFMIISTAFMSETGFNTWGYTLFPKEFSLDAFRFVFANPRDIIDAYLVTIFITVAGTSIGLVLMLAFSYTISREDYKFKNFLSFYIYFTMLFSGGTVGSYIWLTRYLHLYNNILVLFVPSLMSPFYMMILRTFCKSIPYSLIENAKLEGANELYIFFKIIFPLAKAGAATIALFMVFSLWGSWYPSMLYMDGDKNTTIQYYLVKVLNSVKFYSEEAQSSGGLMAGNEPAPEPVRMAICLLAVGPTTIAFPFFQKYFTKGIVVGSVKG